MNAPLRFNSTLLDTALAATQRNHDLFIGGAPVKSGDGRVLERRSPAHGVLVSRCQQAGIAETDAAIKAARQAFDAGPWPPMKESERAAVMGRRIQAGVWINTFMDGFPELPFGGHKQSGLGRKLGRDSVLDYTEEKTLHIHTGPRTSWWLSPQI